MAISESDIKRLWGNAAGRCSFPGCGNDCLASITGHAPVVIGEMAHVIAKKPNGPRGKPEGGEDTYENLILLCPTHHTLVDKAPEGTYPENLLQEWKHNHEEIIRESLQAPKFATREELNSYVKKRLIENHTCWSTYGPESTIAQQNPNSGIGDIWPYRKLSLLIPNNKSIASAITRNSHFFTAEEYRICCQFMEHASGFEHSCLTPLENVPRFPANFEELFNE